jgi:hypothetical protein
MRSKPGLEIERTNFMPGLIRHKRSIGVRAQNPGEPDGSPEFELAFKPVRRFPLADLVQPQRLPW